MSTKEELEKAYFHIINEYSLFYNSEDFYKDLSAFRNLCIRIGFEAAREVYSADEGTNSYRYNIEDFLKEIE
jgi:bifunctional DNase/RNase